MWTMPRYKCHKEVLAFKIAAIEFEQDGSAKIAVASVDATHYAKPGYRERFKGDEDDLGYYVQYEGGYESWSPTKAFEEGYALVSSTLPPHQERVVAEHIQLLERSTKLGMFLIGSVFDGVGAEEQRRLIVQHALMRAYLDVLEERIEAF